MERNPNDTLGTGAGYGGSQNSGLGGSTGGSTGGSALGAGTDSMGVTGTGAGQSGLGTTGTYGSTGAGDVGSLDLGQSTGTTGTGGHQSMGERVSGARDAAADKLSQARDVAGDKLGQAKEKASQLKATLADKLEAGASSLRQPAGASQFAADGSVTANGNPQIQRLQETGANVMQKSAEFLRSGDLKTTVEDQMRTNPGRTLLIALGLGYVLGKAIRGNDNRY